MLLQARSELRVLSSRLDESRTAVSELQSSLTRSAQSVETFATSLKRWELDRKIEAWCYRVAIAGLILAVVLK